MLKDILVIAGRSGLFKLVSKGANMTIIESLIDKKRFPVYAHEKIVAISDSAIFTEDGEAPVGKVLATIKEKEEGKKVSIDFTKAAPDELRAYFAVILPNFDRERVYPTDIKKLLKWYDLLISIGMTDFNTEEEITEESEASEQESEASTLSIPTKRKDIAMSSTQAVKTPKGKPANAIPKKSTVGSKRGG